MRTFLIWTGAGFATAALLVLAANPLVAAVLRSPLHAVLSKSVLLLSFPERGALRTIPVNYVRSGDTILVGSDFSWWRSLVEPTPVTLRVAGDELQGRAQLVSDPRASEAGFRILRPTTYPRALASGAHLIEIDLEPAARAP